ncbi:MAG: 2-isopropylmalate synthase [Nanoarchaeota archaeon]|nr:2-isopropylmalate synthase [Nanoarchaeota archaeon]
MAKKILIFDTTLRDGEQSPGASLTSSEKLLIAKQLAKLGVDIIEAGFPITSESDFESVKQIAEEVKGPIICGLARAMKGDIDRAWEAVKYAERPRIHTFVATSQIHIDKKLRKSQDEVIEMVIEAVRHAKSLCSDVEFSPEDAARTDIRYMCSVVEAAINAGATTINIPDTVGYAEPEEFGNRIKGVFENLGGLIDYHKVVISVHCHDDLGLSVANSLAGVMNGATQVECTINGIGERAGNASLEEFVMNLKTRSDYFADYYTSINTKEIFATSQMVSNLTGLLVQRNKAIVGRNAFAHEAGIHQHGMLKDKKTYEIMDASDVGWRGEHIVIGKHSGRHAVENTLSEMGYGLDAVQIDSVMERIKTLADKSKEVVKEDIIAIATDVLGQVASNEEIVKLVDYSISSGNEKQTSACVVLQVNGEEKKGSSQGVGPVDALSKAITGLTYPLTLKEYHLNAITGGTNALAHVTILVEDDSGTIFSADGISEDIVKASALALVKGLNKAWNFLKK